MKTIAAESSAFRQLQRVLRACLSIALLASAADAASPWRFWTKADGLPESVVFGLTADGAGRIIVKSGDVATLSILDGYQVTEIPVPHAYGRILPSSNHELWTFDSNGIDVRDGAEWRRYPDAQIADFATRSGMLQTRWFTYSVFYGPHDRMDVAPFRNETAVLMFPDRLVEWDRRNGSKRILRLAAQTGLGKFRDVQNTRDGALWLTGEHGVAMLRGSGAGIDWIEIPGPPADRDFMYPIEGENHELFVSATRLGGKRVVLRLAKGLWTEVYAADIALPRLKGWRGPGGTIWIQENRKIFQLNAGNPTVSASTNGKA
ncbi:MAG TPA: hypothetical protein VG273_20310, partial [Bryobacteraceae bacterium]|nr:hypothetical protein [Bryobacteraceae bacterium]